MYSQGLLRTLSALTIGLTATLSLPASSQGDGARMEKYAKFGIERVLTRLLGAETRVDSVAWDKSGKVLEIQGLRIANPEGFSDSDAIFVKAFRVEADAKSLDSEEPVIKLIKTTGAKVNAEISPRGGVNIKTLLDNVNDAREKLGNRPKLRGGGDEPKKKWRIEKGVLQQCAVNIVTPLGNSTRTLDDIDMDFIGDDGKGMTAREAMQKVMGRIVDELAL